MGIILTMGEKEIAMAERRVQEHQDPERGMVQELGVLGFARYYLGGNGVSILREVYPPKAYNDMVYSNVRVKAYEAKTQGELTNPVLKLSGRERRRGLLWWLVAVSPVREKSHGDRFCTAMVIGWYFDANATPQETFHGHHGKTIKMPDYTVQNGELGQVPPTYWIGVSDEGKSVEWGPAVRNLRSEQAKAAGESADKQKARVK